MKLVAIDPKTGLHLRDATPEEAQQYYDQKCHPAFHKPQLVGDVLIDEYRGPGQWFGGAGF